MDYGSAVVGIRGERGSASLRLRVPCRPQLMEWGLQGIASMGPHEGMMFPSEAWPREERIAMWMANVRFPLAMIWVAADGTVAEVEVAGPGDRRTYEHRGLYVVEANAALAPEIGILPGTSSATLDLRAPCG